MDPSTSAYQLLALTALSGECSPDAVSRLGIRPSYGEKLLTKLKEEGYIKTHYRDRLRGYRLTNRGKKLLLTDNPERFLFYLSGSTDTNRPRSDYPRRLRLQRRLHPVRGEPPRRGGARYRHGQPHPGPPGADGDHHRHP